MDPRDSPYAPGAGTFPGLLAGRTRELDRFSIMLDRLTAGRPAEAVLFAGSRGMGKTVLLRECERRARHANWFTSFEEVDPRLPLREVMALSARDVLFDMRATRRFGDRIKRALGVLKAFTSVGVLGVNISFDADLLPGTADTGIFKRDLLALFEELGQVAASDSSGVVFFLDELHTLMGREEMETLDAVLHGLMQRGLPVSAVGAGVFAGPGYEDPDDPDDPTTYGGRIYRVVRLRSLSDESAREALVGPARTKAVEYDPDALGIAISFAGGLPWFIQLVGDAAWERAVSSPITVGEMKSAIDQSQQRLRAEFFPRLLGNLDETTQEVLRVFTDLSGGGASPAQLQAETGLDYGEVQRAIMTLVRRDIVGPTLEGDRCYALAVPQLSEYLVDAGRS